MRQYLILLSLVAVASSALAPGLRAKFNIDISGFGTKSFFHVPHTVSDAVAAGYTQRTRLAGLPLPSLSLYCPNPAVLCTLYDDTGYIAALQVGVNAAQYQPHFDQEVVGMRKWTTDDGTYWIISQYLVSESYLKTPSATRVAKRNVHNILQDHAVWVEGTRGALFEVPRNEKDIGQTPFKTQACTPYMGQHYYYNMSSSTECTAEGLFPWFPMYHSGELTGMGFMNFGPLTVDRTRDWFERSNGKGVKYVVTDGPQCLYDLSDSDSALTMHTYYVEDPRLIKCPAKPSGK